MRRGITAVKVLDPSAHSSEHAAADFRLFFAFKETSDQAEV